MVKTRNPAGSKPPQEVVGVSKGVSAYCCTKKVMRGDVCSCRAHSMSRLFVSTPQIMTASPERIGR